MVESPSTPPAAGQPGTNPLRYELPGEAAGERTDRLLGAEFLLTNGLGGFAMGTAMGVPTRRYHGLLIAATNPPVGRVVALHSIVERLEIVGPTGRRSVELSNFEFLDSGGNRLLHPAGAGLLDRFTCDQAPAPVQAPTLAGRSAAWTLVAQDPELGRIEVSKPLTLDRGSNACTVAYAISLTERKSLPKGTALELRLRPLTPLRDFHALRRRHECDRYRIGVPDAQATDVRVELDHLALDVSVTDATFTQDSQWWFGVFYRAEADRQQDCLEDLFSPGEFVWSVKPDRSGNAATQLRASLVSPTIPSLPAPRHNAGSLAKTDGQPTAATDPRLARLLAAASDFVVVRTAPVRTSAGRLVTQPADGGVSVIAGYPWFSDWGRDTFISLPGLMLRTERFDEARRTLDTFAACRRDGLIPNVFNDQTGEPEYNTVDASLWFIHAACEHARLSGDDAPMRGEVGRACLEIIDHYRRGDAGGPEHAGVFNICMDPFDKLIMAGNESTQLTWMDARRDGVTFTPRHGKPVEINALWYNALCSLSERLTSINPTAAANLRDLAAVVRSSFASAYWNGSPNGARGKAQQAAEGFLNDCLAPAQVNGRPAWTPIPEIRPNQLLAVSLPHSPLSKPQQHAVLATVRQRLLTPMGVRTLDPSDPRYRGRYEGRLFDRDAAYHQGTAWPWLLGVYAMAVLRAGDFSAEARAEAERSLAPILAEMNPATTGRVGCFGQIAEVFDGDEPQRPSGCPAQAWSVAVILEAMHMLLAGRA